MTVCAVTFARGGSKGVIRKNLRHVGGIPLLGHAINHAQRAQLVNAVYVSTEDAEIAETARLFGAGVIDRPPELATDDAPEWACWQHAVRTLGMGAGDVFVSVPCTAPLRVPADVDAVIQRLQETDADAVITVTEARHNPYFNQVQLSDDDEVCLVALCLSETLLAADLAGIIRRQEAPAVYDCCTVAYAARPDYVLRAPSLLSGNVRAVVVPAERALDIDRELDLRIADFLWRERGEIA